MKRRRQKPWSIAKVYGEHPCALAVWLVLCELSEARKSAVVTPTRAELSARSGANVKSVSAGLTLLERAGWIDRVHVPVRVGGRQTATLLRVILRRSWRSTPHTVRAAVEGVQRPKGRGRSTPQDFSQKRRAREPVAPSAVGVRATPAPAPPEEEDQGPRVSIAEALGLTKGAENAK